MIKKLLVFVVVLTMLAMYTGTAFAAPSTAGSVVELLTAHGGMSGSVFIFRVSGEFSGAELQGSVQMADGTQFTLFCAQVDAETVRCLTSSKVWGDVTVTFGGASFTTYVGPFERVFTSTSTPFDPTEPSDPTGPTEFCYDVYTWAFPTSDAWVSMDTKCQSSPANYGDIVNLEDTLWGGFWNYEFMPTSPVCPFSRSGDAYYYNGCP